MTTHTDIATAAALLALRRLETEEMRRVAGALLDAGEYTPAAGNLVMMAQLDREEAHDLFVEMLSETATPLPSEDEAVLTVLRDRLQRIVDGRTPPYEGLMQLEGEVGLHDLAQEESLGLEDVYGRVHVYCEVCFPALSDVDRIARDDETRASAKRWLARHGS